MIAVICVTAPTEGSFLLFRKKEELLRNVHDMIHLIKTRDFLQTLKMNSLFNVFLMSQIEKN